MPAATTNRVVRKSTNLTNELYTLLKKDIVECRLTPGEVLQESFVRERYQIGHTPFREACQRLEAEGLIQIVPRRDILSRSFRIRTSEISSNCALLWRRYPLNSRASGANQIASGQSNRIWLTSSP